MAQLEFTKMQSCGNDYLYFDCFCRKAPEDPAQTARVLSHRHRGVGADGIILILPDKDADAAMRIYNADGSEGKMCGNGLRCTAEYLFLHGYVKGDTANIRTAAGMRTVVRKAPGLLQADMGVPSFAPCDVPVQSEKPVIEQLCEVNGGALRFTCLSVGNPHCVIFVDDVRCADVRHIGEAVQYSRWFPEGANVEFVQVLGPTSIRVRVWERGSGETQSCGTGACAAACVCVRSGRCRRNAPITVYLEGGELTVFDTGENLLLTGEAQEVFTGAAAI